MLSMEERKIIARLLLQEEEAQVEEQRPPQDRSRDHLGRYAKESFDQPEEFRSRSIKLSKIRGSYNSYNVVDDVDVDLMICGAIILLFAIVL